MSQKIAIIIGAGPAGLTAAYELLEKTGVKPIIYEMTGDIGGISKTVNYKGNRIDIGGHRFFSKSDRVMQWWQNILPVQGMPSKDDIILGRDIPLSKEVNAPDPEKTDKVMLVRQRVSRIFFLRKFFDYPISLTMKTLSELGFIHTFKITLSYIRARLFPIKEEKNLEDFFINRFGRELYSMFFRDYTQKVWGVPCTAITPEWGVQRIKGLSITRAVWHAVKSLLLKDTSISQKKTETSLINQFIYPKLGPGQMWQEVARIVEERGGEIHLKHKVIGLKHKNNKIVEIEVKDETNGNVTTRKGDYFISTMPVKELIESLGERVPHEVRQVAQGLIYRDFITVGLLLKKLNIKNETKIQSVNNIMPDKWLYIQEKDVKVGRVQIFNNWSPYMVKDLNTVWIGAEYFCTEGDELWSKSDNEFAEFAIDELAKINIIKKEDVFDYVVIRLPKTYPAYFGSYNNFDVIRKYVDNFQNLFLIGRNGMHRYNNMDHSMLTAMQAVQNIATGKTCKDNICAVNAEHDYHERRLTSLQNLIDAYIEKTCECDFKYNPDIYWNDTEISYPYYPTVRHRRRFILNSIEKYSLNKPDVFIFDYGCGEATMLKEIKHRFKVKAEQLGGSDISKTAIYAAKSKVDSPYLYCNPFPELDRKCDVIICCELIEHTKDFHDILYWIKNNLTAEGLLILTTQSGKIHASDKYTGHTQHFSIHQLNAILKRLGFDIKYSSLWGFPFFTLQKYLTNVNFDKVRCNYLEGELTFRKKIVFEIAYLLYYVHDLIGFGPQIYIIASNRQ